MYENDDNGILFGELNSITIKRTDIGSALSSGC